MSLSGAAELGSAMNVGIPWRTWLTVPDGTIDLPDKYSLLKYCSALGGANVGGLQVCGNFAINPRLKGNVFVRGRLSGGVDIHPTLDGKVEMECC